MFAQIAAEVLGIPMDMVNVVTAQDTDIAPFDTGAYASRQTFVTGIAVRKAALEARAKVLAIAARKCGLAAGGAGPPGRRDRGEGPRAAPVCSLEEVAMESYYDRIHADPIKSDVSANVRINAMSYGATFVAVEVDMQTGKIEVLELYNVHDSGTIINPHAGRGPGARRGEHGPGRRPAGADAVRPPDRQAAQQQPAGLQAAHHPGHPEDPRRLRGDQRRGRVRSGPSPWASAR